MKKLIPSLGLVAMLVIGSNSYGQVLIDSFEDGTVAPWAPDTIDATLSIDPNDASHGTKSLLVQRATADGTSRNDLKMDPVPLASLLAGTKLLFDVKATGGPGNDLPGWWMNLTPIINSDGTGWAQGPDAAITVDGAWHTYSWDYSIWKPSLATATWQQLFFQGNSGSDPSEPWQYHFDNVRVIPEPASLALVSVSGLLLVSLKRRRSCL